MYLYVLHKFNYTSQKWCIVSSADEYDALAAFNTFPVNDAFDLFITSKVDANYFEVESEVGEVYILERVSIQQDTVIDLEI